MNRKQVFAALILIILARPGISHADESALNATLEVDNVQISDANMQADWNASGERWTKTVGCQGFVGTQAGNEIYVRAISNGAAGDVIHKLTYIFNEKEFKTNDKAGKWDSAGIHTYDLRDGETVSIRIPELRDTVKTKAMLYLRLYSVDQRGETYSFSGGRKVMVSRPLYLTRAIGADAEKLSCRETLPPELTQIGDQLNSSSSESTLSISQILENSQTDTKGMKWGIYFSPTAWGFSLFSLNLEYFHETSKQVTESVKVNNTFNLRPGDAMRIYSQEARVVEPFDATLVDPCGGEHHFQNAYYIQKWQTGYYVYPIMHNGSSEVSPTIPGMPVVNTCSDKPINDYQYEDGQVWTRLGQVL